jgi:hypothetical protein
MSVFRSVLTRTTPDTLVHAHARLNPADRDRLAQGLTKTLGAAVEQEAHERER